jgi:hypothetical protein
LNDPLLGSRQLLRDGGEGDDDRHDGDGSPQCD